MTALWTEKYRPKRISECILPDRLKQEFSNMIESGNLPHLLLTGDSGVGKTTIAKIMCDELNCDFIELNGSNGELNIDKLRDDVTEFVSTVPLQGRSSLKVVLIDEADGLNHNIQPALRNFMEKYKSARFILTANYPDKIMTPLQSRCARVDFKFNKDELTKMIRGFATRLTGILGSEGVEFDNEGIIHVCKTFFPDFRAIINECQRYSNYNGRLDAGIVNLLSDEIQELFSGINNKDFGVLKQWCAEHMTSSIFNTLFKHYDKYIDANNQPMFIMCLGEGMKAHSTVPNQELNLLCTLVNYMENV